MLGIQDFDFAEQSAIKCSVPRGTEDDDLPTALQPVSIPRAYQMDIFNKAMRDNVIAILDTGAGKTLIAALLIRHLHNIDAFEKLKRRWSIFLVPKVPLVCQQQKYLAGNLNLRVKAFYGDMSLDTWTVRKWEDELRSCDVIVSTPDIFKQLLMRAIMRLKEVNVIVFDEAHHARKNHTYKTIMDVHYSRTPAEERPKIFGLTASPAMSKEDVEMSIRILEQNLQSKAYTCEISTFVSRPDEYIKYFDQGPFFAPPKLYQDMIENGANYMPSLAAALQSSLRIGDALGPWCSERMLELALHDVAQKFRYTRKRDSLIDERVDDSKEAERILRNLEAHVLTARRLGDNIVAPKHEELSPKVHALFDVLGKFKHIEKDFCAIVFCDQRWSTSVLAMAIKNWPALSWIRPGVIVGHGQGKTSLACMSVKDQYDTMTNFRTGKINLLLATCVAEEGLDIQSCNLVIRFDMFASLASYIQSRGRARHHESLFVVLSQRNNPLEAAVLTTMYAEEQKMRRALFANENGKDDTEITETAQKPKPDEIFCVESTGACVSLQSSIETLHKYCQTLPTDGYTKTQPEYTEETVSIALSEAPNAKMQNRVICRLVLPMNVPDECRVIIGRPAGNKTVARRWAALEAIQRLFYVGELDERLCPIRPEKPLQVQQEAKQAKKIEVREYVYRNPILYGQSWGETSTARLHRIYLTEKGKTKRMFSVGLLTPMDDNIPDFTFDYIQEDVQCEAHIEPIPGNIQMTSERLKVVRGFHYELFVSILRSKFTRNSDFTALLIPVNDEEALEGAEQVADWRMLFDLHSESKDTVEDLLKSGEFDKRDWKNVVLYDHVHYKRRFFIQGLHKDLQPRSTENLPRKLGKHKCIADYYTYRLGYKGEIHENQPILSAVPIGVPFLTVPATYHDRDETLVIPQFCKIHPVPATVMAYEAPRITLLLYHLHHNLLAMEVQKGWPADFFCHIEPRKRRAELPVSLSTLRPALTASCSELTFDYERLEYLGDSFLKMFLTLHFFVLNPRRHEGFLTEARRMVENNTFLRSRATLEDIQGTMMFHKMKRLDWFPPVNESMRRTQFIPNKTVADAIEAIIGACILESQEKGGAIATKRFLGSEFKDDISDYLDIWNQHMTQTDNRQRRLHAERMMRSVHLVQETIGYKFVNPRYAVEAITHASSLGPNVDGTGDCYERLEFLGDSVLGYVVAVHLFKTYPDMNPHHLSDFRSALVNNQFLATVACSLQLHKHLDHMSSVLAKAMMEFSVALEAKLSIVEGDMGWAPRKKVCSEATSFRNSIAAVTSSISLESLETEAELAVARSNRLIKAFENRAVVGDIGASDARPQHDQRDGAVTVEGGSAMCENQDVVDLTVELVSESGNEMVRVRLDAVDAESTAAMEVDKVDQVLVGQVHSEDLKPGLENDSFMMDVQGNSEVLAEGDAEDITVVDVVTGNPDSSSQTNKRPADDSVEIVEEDVFVKKLDRHGLSPFFWDDLVTAPKAAGDIYEALIGAVYLDSGMNIDAAWDVIQRTLINRWWPRFELSTSLNMGKVDKNAVSDFLALIKEFRCQKTDMKYEFYGSFSVVTYMDRFAKNSKFSIHDCTIVFHGKRVGTATAASRKDAKKLACRMAANYLRDHRHAMRRECVCRRRQGSAPETVSADVVMIPLENDTSLQAAT